MLDLGKINTLQVQRATSVGMFLADATGDEVLLPMKYVEDIRPGDQIDVFVYKDSEDRPVAVTTKPILMRDQFGYLRVNDIASQGAFLYWGMEKDLLLPYREQNRNLKQGDNVLVYVYIDNLTHRLVASMRLNKFFSREVEGLNIGDEVQILVTRRTDLGFSCIVENRFEGMIYFNEIYKPVKSGDRVSGWISNVREDGKLDIRLQQWGTEVMDENAEIVYQKLKSSGGKISIGDKSAPELIQAHFGMSKRNFKQAAGNLYKAGKIKIADHEISIVS
ncbi:MAG: GntR family transcriptional regulator [Bacteroidetes bacterium]|nr:GntR family transcriptional regulator [Bacteroidota bacterium]